MRAHETMTESPACCTPDDAVKRAAQLMVENDCGCVPAVEDTETNRIVGVVIEAAHLCMMMRGVEKQNSPTITSALKGCFLQDLGTREEFLRLAHAPGVR